jgi:hypothetical protein
MRVLYKNTTGSTVTASTGDVFLPGESKTLFRYLPDPGALTIITRDGSPIVNIANGVLPLAAVNLSNCSQIKLYNASGDDAEVVFNGDTQNAVIWPNGFIDSILVNGEIDTIDVDGDGAGSFYIWGITRKGGTTYSPPPAP